MQTKNYKSVFNRLLICLSIIVIATGFVGCNSTEELQSEEISASSDVTSSDVGSEETSSLIDSSEDTSTPSEASSEISSSHESSSQTTNSNKPSVKPQPEPKPEPQEQPRKKLNLITPDGDDQAYHPSVVSFESGWNGYKYWIAFTPYPNADATKENPTINASNDMVNWIVPEGIVNPVDKPEEADANHYNSDTHLIYNPQENRLELFWRYVANTPSGNYGSVTIFRSVSYDGVNWLPKTVFLLSEKRDQLDFISPTIIFENGMYRIWYVDNDKRVYYTEVTDDAMSEPTVCAVSYEEDLKSWHIDVMYNSEKAVYEMVVCAFKQWSERHTMSLYYARSADGINWTVSKEILKPSTVKEAWDSQGIYRAALLYENGNYFLFYSAHSRAKNDVGVGVLTGKDIYNLTPFY